MLARGKRAHRHRPIQENYTRQFGWATAPRGIQYNFTSRPFVCPIMSCMLRLHQPRRRFHFWNKWGPQVDCRLASYMAKTRPSEPNRRSAEPDNLFVLMNLGVPRHHTSYIALKTPLPEKDSISLVDIREVGGSGIPILHASSLSLSLCAIVCRLR